jgi:hypothetical protein
MRGGLVTIGLLFLIVANDCNEKNPHPPALNNPVHDISDTVLDARQNELLLTYPTVNSGNASTFWQGSLNLSQRVEFAGGTQALEEVEKANNWHAIQSVNLIHGSEPTEPSAHQFNTEVTWDKLAPEHFKSLPHWSEHIALLHPGQYGYQQNQEGNPFLGIVVLFNNGVSDTGQLGGQYHIDFRSLFGHYFPENGDIGNPDNYKSYVDWYGYIDNFVPAQ